MIAGILYSIAIGAALVTIILAGSVGIIGAIVSEAGTHYLEQHKTTLTNNYKTIGAALVTIKTIKNPNANIYSLNKKIDDYLNNGGY